MNLHIPSVERFPLAKLADDSDELFSRKSPKLSFFVLMHGPRSDVEECQMSKTYSRMPESWRASSGNEVSDDESDVSSQSLKDSKPSGDDEVIVAQETSCDCYPKNLALNVRSIIASILHTASQEDLRQFCSATSLAKIIDISYSELTPSRAGKNISKKNPVASIGATGAFVAINERRKDVRCGRNGGDLANKDFTVLIPDELLGLL